MTKESPRVPEMTEKHAQVAFESIRNFNIFRVEAKQVHEVISSLASGRLQTYSPESEVAVPLEKIEEALRLVTTNHFDQAALRGMLQEWTAITDRFGHRFRIEKTEYGFTRVELPAVSTKQEVSE